MTTELLIGFAKPMLQKFLDKPLKDQSIVVEQALNLFGDYFEDLKNGIPLQNGEDDLLIMLQLQPAQPETETTEATERQINFVPSMITEDDRFSRLFIDEEGVNLTRLSQSIPVPKLILLFLTMVSGKSDEHTDVFSELKSIITEAVNLPECKLHNEVKKVKVTLRVIPHIGNPDTYSLVEYSNGRAVMNDFKTKQEAAKYIMDNGYSLVGEDGSTIFLEEEDCEDVEQTEAQGLASQLPGIYNLEDEEEEPSK